MIITTPSGSKFNTDLPAKSNLLMVFNDNGNQEFDRLRITGKYTIITEFMKPIAMIEVEHSFGIDEVCEEYIWQ